MKKTRTQRLAEWADRNLPWTPVITALILTAMGWLVYLGMELGKNLCENQVAINILTQ